ncbi:rRNA-processing arch domain-containing protein [Piptocephalis cylindrospora]|uniref:rRNA-processing arch domain-containing protein n=1 Tax=Piptocephalis cylindrospora TaxID=1907219 RepID=A0A4P9Y5Y9_9FUNG|nr:rRNA-processing arch domain-containing protein [Piptocephalis cylindrospora]|eukprot:RKP13641.1 rRNA-processing arch domain-containing protein [Piptocephalis cylindrospora]
MVADSFEEEASRQVPTAPGLERPKAAASTTKPGDKETSTTENTDLVKLSHQIRHEVAIPPDYDYIPLSQHVPPAEPARTYPFTLDPFQSMSVAAIERNESVLVSAHTSAGKTVVAEYAIAQSLRAKQRVIYTSPIKALSNQKYRELEAEFGDVGLMTGDITIRPEASCLVMTTEILRSMLYRGSEMTREVAWVVYDEIHYMRDKERGVVWEETLILLPRQVRYVFLSATIPNALQFAQWICRIQAQPCHVVYTDFRPTPLQHYLFPAGGDGIHLVVDEKSQFREENFQRAVRSLAERRENLEAEADAGGSGKTVRGGAKVAGRKGKGNDGPSDIYKIIKMIMLKSYHPVIVFSFSKRECEALAMQMSKMDFNDEDERAMIGLVFDNAMAHISKEDRDLPQIQHLLPLLRRGIGIHHSGLLPLLKEVVEILFQEGLIKVLFATETFSIGLNMPARTVVFTSVRKFDGTDTRWVSSGEYIQMSGRAGRRGLDDRGIVILMLDENMEPAVAKGMVKGQADRLNSAFHLSYNMILNLLRVEGISPEYILERCFKQFQNSSALPELQGNLKALEEEKDALIIPREKEIREYWDLRAQLDTLGGDVRRIVHSPRYVLPFLQPGRMVKVEVDGGEDGNDRDFGWGSVVNLQKVREPVNKGKWGAKGKPNKSVEAEPEYIVDVALWCLDQEGNEKDSKSKSPLPCLPGQQGQVKVVPLPITALNGVSTLRIYLPKDLSNVQGKGQVRRSLEEVKKRYQTKVPLLDPLKDLRIESASFSTLLEKISLLEAKMKLNKITTDPELPELYDSYQRKRDIEDQIKGIKKQVTTAVSVLSREELRNRKRVLRRLGFTTQADVVDTKGRVACEISSGDPLLLTEMIFHGVFNDLSISQIVALLSCFVFTERVEQEVALKAELEGPLKTLQTMARKIAKVSRECKIELDEEEYVSSFQSGLMDVVDAWVKGATFAQICRMTDIFEGSLIRAFRMLEELLRQMAAASKAIGNVELEGKFADGIVRIKRDIIFASSLYL